jgi:hypothetical protein
MNRQLSALSAAVALTAAALAQPQPAPQPAPAAPQAAHAISSASDLLAQLETADANLRALDADILYQRVFGLEGDQQERRGRLYFVDSKALTQDAKPAPGSRKFAIHFKSLKLGDQPPMAQDQVLVFDGEWLVEKQPQQQQIIKRQITRAGGFDPLKVGEGPFPLPIGQKRADILSRFEAELLPATRDLVAEDPAMQQPLENFVRGSHQLKLTPKPGERSIELSEIRLWYRPDPVTGQLLPRMARTVTPTGDVSLVQLANVKVNQSVPAEALDTATPPGWKQDIQELSPENRR